MKTNYKQQARIKMRHDIYSAIRRNRSYGFTTLSRHEIVEVLVSIMSDQLDIIGRNAQNQRMD